MQMCFNRNEKSKNNFVHLSGAVHTTYKHSTIVGWIFNKRPELYLWNSLAVWIYWKFVRRRYCATCVHGTHFSTHIFIQNICSIFMDTTGWMNYWWFLSHFMLWDVRLQQGKATILIKWWTWNTFSQHNHQKLKRILLPFLIETLCFNADRW